MSNIYYGINRHVKSHYQTRTIDQNMWWCTLFLLMVPSLMAHEVCLHLIKISSLNDLAQVNLSDDPLFIMDQNQFAPRDHQAIQVSCIRGTVFESRQVELNKFLDEFQNLRIFSKPQLEVHTDLYENEINAKNNIHRSFNLVLKGQVYPPISMGSRPLFLTTFDFWPNHHFGPVGLVGPDLNLIKLLAQKFQFTYTFLPPALSINGRTLPNGTIVGIIPDIQNGVADLAMCQLTLTNDRYQIVEYAPILSEHDIILVGPKAKPKSAYQALILPFDYWTWLFLCLAVFGSFVVLASFKVYLNSTKTLSENMYEAFCLAITPLVQESISPSLYRVKGFTSVYCYLFLWMGIGLLLALAYKSTLLATMTMVVFNDIVDTPEEVLKSRLPVYVVSQSLTEIALLRSPLKIYREIYDQNVTPFGTAFPLSATPPDMNDNINNGRAFLISTRTNTIRDTNRYAFSDSIYIGATSWLGQKGSRFLAQISDPIMRLQAGGITNKWLEVELQTVLDVQELEKNRPKHEPINFGHMTPPFILLACSLIICFGIFAMEVICLGSRSAKNP